MSPNRPSNTFSHCTNVLHRTRRGAASLRYIHPPRRVRVPWLMFAGYVPLASQSPYPTKVYSVANYRPHLRPCLHGVGDPSLVGLVSFVFTLWGTKNKRNLPLPLLRAEIDNRGKPGFKYYKTYWTFLCFTSSHFIYMRILWLEIKETRVLFCITSFGGCNAKKLPKVWGISMWKFWLNGNRPDDR